MVGGARDVGNQRRRGHARLGIDLQPDQFATVAAHLQDGVVKVAESGLLSPADVARVHAEGADVVLVGESLVTHSDPTTAVAALVSATS